MATSSTSNDLTSFLDSVWEEKYLLLKEFLTEHGRLPYQREKYKGVALGNWLKTQKDALREDKLIPYRFNKLNDLGALSLKRIHSWESHLELLKEFKETFHRFPQQLETYKGVNIGTWYSNQKMAIQRASFPPARFKKLEEIGFSDSFSFHKWLVSFHLLKEFMEKYNRCPQLNESYQGYNLGRWLYMQRRYAKSNELSLEKRSKLLELSLTEFTFDPSTMVLDHVSSDENWKHMYFLLTDFLTVFGRFPTENEIYKDINLGRWCETQKERAASCSLPVSRFNRLFKLGFFKSIYPINYSYPDARWDYFFRLLQDYLAEFGRFPRQQDTYKDENLGAWCSTQKFRTKYNQLRPDRQSKLESIGLFETTREAAWNRKFELLQEFVREFNRFPKKGETYHNVMLGDWLILQRESFENNKLSPDRTRKFSEAGFLDTICDRKWETSYRLLEEFVIKYDRFPTYNESYKDVNLGTWCAKQKSCFKLNQLPADRLEKLQSIGLFETTQAAKWEQNFNLLLQFIAEYGHLPGHNTVYHSVNLGYWCRRNQGRAKQNKLSPYRLAKLKETGLLDENNQSSRLAPVRANDLKWNHKFQLLTEFEFEYGCFPRFQDTYKGVNIGTWVATQKAAVKNKTISPERLAQLRKIGLISDN